MKYYCLNCKEYFDEPESKTTWSHSNYIGFDGMYPETECRCPECGSEYFDEARDECELCGEIVYETKTIGDYEVCPDCLDKLKDIMDKTVMDIVGEFELIDSLDAQGLISNFFEEE